MVAVIGIDAELIDDFKVILAPVLDIDQRVIQRRAVIAAEGIDAAQNLGGCKHIRRDDFIQQARKFPIGETDTVEFFELRAEVLLKHRAINEIGTVGVFQLIQLGDQAVFDLLFRRQRIFGSI